MASSPPDAAHSTSRYVPGIKGLLVRNLEHLSPAQFAKILGSLDRDRYGQEIAAAWIAKKSCATR